MIQNNNNINEITINGYFITENYNKLIQYYMSKYQSIVNIIDNIGFNDTKVNRKHHWDLLRKLFITLEKYERYLIKYVITRYTIIKVIEKIYEYIENKRGRKKNIFKNEKVFKEIIRGKSNYRVKEIIHELLINIDNPFILEEEKYDIKADFIIDIINSLVNNKNEIRKFKMLYENIYDKEKINNILKEVNVISKLRKVFEELAIILNIGYLKGIIEKELKIFNKKLREIAESIYRGEHKNRAVNIYVDTIIPYILEGFILGIRKMNWYIDNITNPLTFITYWIRSRITLFLKKIYSEEDVLKTIHYDIYSPIYDNNEKVTYENRYLTDDNSLKGYSDIDNKLYVEKIVNIIKKYGDNLTDKDIETIIKFINEDINVLPQNIIDKIKKNEKLMNGLRTYLCN